MDLKEKRRRLLNLLDGASVRAATWERYIGPGVWLKVERLLFMPRIYLRYLRARFNFAHQKVTAQTFWGYKMLLPPEDLNAFAIYALGTLGRENEDKLARFLIRNLQPFDIFYDIGANFGFYTFLASEFISEGEVHAFEPVSHVFAFLKHNTQRHLACILNNCALSDRDGIIPFYLGTIASGSSTMIGDVARATGWNHPKEIEVISTTIDSYVKTHKAPTVLKIDTEGAEYAIIKGGRIFFEKEFPTIVMEVWEEDRGKQFSLPAIQELYALGYKSYTITSEGFLKEVGNAPSLIGKTFDNVVFRK